jgi:hypothetical protein
VLAALLVLLGAQPVACSASETGAETDTVTDTVADSAPGSDTHSACGNGQLDPGEPCDGGTLPCVDLGTSWSGGAAACRPDCSGWEVSGCARAQGATEVVKPALRDPARWALARCNDGTPFTFRVSLSPSGSHDWVLALRGGGLCDNNAVPCLIRPPELTSTRPEQDGEHLAEMEDAGGLMSRDPALNPTFYKANLVYAWYCSSDMWTGTGTERQDIFASKEGWYFSGRHNVAALLAVLAERYGMDDAAPDTRVLWEGASAGAFGAAANVDQVAGRLPLTAAAGRLKVFLDAGWLVWGWDDPEARLGLGDEPDVEVMRQAAAFFSSRFSPLCEQARLQAGGEAGDCWFARWSVPMILSPPPAGHGLPVFVQQSLQDEVFAQYHGIVNDPERIAQYGARTLEEMEQHAPWRFSGDLPYHDASFDDQDLSIGAAGRTIYEALARFWEGGQPEAVLFQP